MHAYLALFDPSIPVADGSCWTWRAPQLPRNLLDRIYYDFAAQHRPHDVSQVSASSLTGGAVGIAEWVVLYRFVNGGRDAHGRSGRFAVVVAAVNGDEARGRDLSAVMTSPEVTLIVSRIASSTPVPQPPCLEFVFTGDSVQPDPLLVTRAMSGEHVEAGGEGALKSILAVCTNLPLDREWSCQFQQRPEGEQAKAECLPSAAQRELPQRRDETPAASPSRWSAAPDVSPWRKRLFRVRIPRVGVAMALLAIAAFWGGWKYREWTDSSDGFADGNSALTVRFWKLEPTGPTPQEVGLALRQPDAGHVNVISGAALETATVIVEASGGRYEWQTVDHLLVVFDTERLDIISTDRADPAAAMPEWWGQPAPEPTIVLLDQVTGSRIEATARRLIVHEDAGDGIDESREQ